MAARYWLIRSDSSAVRLDVRQRRLEIATKRRPRIAEGDFVVILERANGRRIFGHTAKILSSSGGGEAPMGELGSVILLTDEWTTLPEGMELDELQWSLTIIKNFERPWLHFQRPYRLLPKADFETIRRGEIFLARSGYYELLRALPTALRLAFEAEQLIELGGRQQLDPFEARLRRLYRFIQDRVLSVGSMLLEIEALAAALELRDGNGALFEHRFVDEEAEKAIRVERVEAISIQVQRFRDLFEALEVSGVDVLGEDVGAIAAILDEMGNPDRRSEEARFEAAFARSA